MINHKLETFLVYDLSKRDKMTIDIYKELIKAAEEPTSINLRTQMALCILAVTEIRINELLPLKGSQLKTLFKENLIAIGYRNLDTTSAFIKQFSDQERQERISQLQIPSEKSLLYH